MASRRAFDLDDLAEGLRAGSRSHLARAITLIESRKADHQALGQELLNRLLPATGQSHRIGITGVPGVGKSTLLDSFGVYLTGQGHRVAVLAVDPSSGKTGGSILGDKTRMPRLAVDPKAYIRPSPASGVLGGVARATRETMLLCEAAGHDIILVETVGAGQNEYMVADMVDSFLVLMLPNAGDDLQGIKKGVLELADVLAVNKADIDAARTHRALNDYKAGLHILTSPDASWQPMALAVSGLEGIGLDALWQALEKHRQVMQDKGLWDSRRADQRVKWMWSLIEDRLLAALRSHEAVAAKLPALTKAVSEGDVSSTQAAWDILSAFGVSAPSGQS